MTDAANTVTVTDARFMALIHAKWGALIAQVCKSSSVPPAFLAALIAGESGGDPNAKRFEPGVLVSFWEVLLGRKASFGSIGRDQLLPTAIPLFATPVDFTLQYLDSLATSWGLTQIMGYNAQPLTAVGSLANPSVNLQVAIHMLATFAHEFDLDLAEESAELFRCWNTGRPNGETADPRYVDRGLARMKRYADLPPVSV